MPALPRTTRQGSVTPTHRDCSAYNIMYRKCLTAQRGILPGVRWRWYERSPRGAAKNKRRPFLQSQERPPERLRVTGKLGGRFLRDYFADLRAVLAVAGDLELDLVAFNLAFELLHHRVAVELALHFEGDIVAIHFAVRDLARGRGSVAAAAHAGNLAGDVVAGLLQGNGYGTAGVTAASGLFIGPLAADIGS